MKLKNFLVIGAVVGAAGIAGTYVACRGGDDEAPKAESKDKATVDKKPPPAPTPAPTPTPTPTPTPAPAPADDLRPVDRVLVGWAGKDLGAKKKKDVTKGNAYKVNLYQDDGNVSVNRAKVDLDRDDKWDEKWTFDGTQISRKVAPADDENYSEHFVWTGSSWAAE